ncbi:ABC transporter substrate-binding protein [Patiriisocius hiemis]|uniref:Helical backbone metal receptor n=1 Tax=Patiriisocius hiemis TaxID=3075604 RepID=A0ABU2YDS3_9FLAO|nr:helical backbone metal receptor [Constantimarinum sp. W242]MDT0555945.1 helical backbone metal receptor [Constantimarinum sp. W242]
MECVDQLGRKLQFSKPPKRVVSLVPSQTELLVDIGLRENLVGVTKFCIHPKDLRKNITVVGGTKNVNYKKIEALRPDIIICNKEENTKEIVEGLSLIAPVWVSDIYTIEHVFEMIHSIGEIFNVSQNASILIEGIKSSKASFLKNFQPVEKSVYYLIWKNPFMVAGQDTFINTLLKLNNYKNLSEKNSRYPEVSITDLKKADLVLLSSEPFPFKEQDMIKLKKELNTEVLLVDGEYFSWYGSRLKDSFNYFKSLH